MGRRKKSFIDRKTAVTYELVHRPKEELDAGDANGLYVLRRVGKNATEDGYMPEVVDPEMPQVQWDDDDGEDADADDYSRTKWELGEYGFPDDGHDYSQHLKESAGGVFIPADGVGDATLNQLLEREEQDKMMELRDERKRNSELDAVMALLESGSEEEDGAADVDDEGTLDGESVATSTDAVLPDDFVEMAGINRSQRTTGFDPRVELEAAATAAVEAVDPEQQRLLDEHFDRFLEGYSDDDLDSDEVSAELEKLAGSGADDGSEEDDADEEQRRLEESVRADLERMEGPMDEFLEGVSKIGLEETHGGYARLAHLAEDLEGDLQRDLEVVETRKERSQWDCESIVSTYSNLDNHPRVIGMPAARSRTIRLDPRLGAPADYLGERPPRPEARPAAAPRAAPASADTSAGRKKGETAEERRFRKEAVKNAKRERRSAKKELKQAFRDENNRQGRIQAAMGTGKVSIQYS